MRRSHHRIDIRPVTRGFQVVVGCQTLVYGETIAEKTRMARDLKEYLLDPVKKVQAFHDEYGVPNAPYSGAETEATPQEHVPPPRPRINENIGNPVPEPYPLAKAAARGLDIAGQTEADTAGEERRE